MADHVSSPGENLLSLPSLPIAEMEAAKASVLSTLSKFHTSISTPTLPLTAARALVIPSARRVSLFPGSPPLLLSLSETLDALEARIRDGHPIVEELASPDPEVWIHNDLAAVWAGFRISVHGEQTRHGVHLLSFLSTPDGWKISGMVALSLAPSQSLPPISKDPLDPDVIGPINACFAALARSDLSTFQSYFHPEMGAVLSRPSGLILNRLEGFVGRLKEVVDALPEGTSAEEIIFDAEMRRCGDVAFAWTPFVVSIGGVVRSRGVNVFMMIKEGGDEKGEWMTVGICDTSVQVTWVV